MKTALHISYSTFALFAFACFALAPQAGAVCQRGCDTFDNTFLGDDAFISNTTGNDNTAVGFNALFTNTTGETNTAFGSQALINNTTGDANTANGYQALFYNTTGSSNTANGNNALAFNTSGNGNTADGFFARNANTTGTSNTADGLRAMWFNTTGSGNTAVGRNALAFNANGDGNIAIGFLAGENITRGSNNIDIGSPGAPGGERATIRIGTIIRQMNTYIAGISGATVPDGVAVVVGADGHLGTTTSSARYKEAIEPMNDASEAILSLKPVTFRYKQELDPDAIPQFGLVAEDVAKVNPDSGGSRR